MYYKTWLYLIKYQQYTIKQKETLRKLINLLVQKTQRTAISIIIIFKSRITEFPLEIQMHLMNAGCGMRTGDNLL